ncbi:hypothetical protein WICPIJ_007127 [Wickerhamomyces pijperi]|uniref:FHA domain-containing protein n=1 Tax=Wickerhamomyces pijperi TaxID=599730 RepID=A0A9P8Q147_WICPI|nr:hypothetical protein WICPIJ_007127 [Wickerhamomyces pijperi]
MSNSTKFPPSSPLLDLHQLDNEDPFSCGPIKPKGSKLSKKFIINSPILSKPVKNSYPTPNPSSSLGIRSSSPVREQQTQQQEQEQEQEQPQSRKEVIIKERTDFHPETSKLPLIVKLTSSERVSLGRSTHCDYFIRSKFASRNHLNLRYDIQSNELTLLCTGFNGAIVKFKDTAYGYIKEVGQNKYYFNKLEYSPKDDERFTEISMFKGEQLIIPYMTDLSLDIKGYQIKILNFVNNTDKLVDDSETEDELPILNNSRLTSISPQIARSQQIPASSPPKQVEMEEKANISFPSSPALKEVKSTKPTKESINSLEKCKSLEPSTLSQQNAPALQRSKSTDTLKKANLISKILSFTDETPDTLTEKSQEKSKKNDVAEQSHKDPLQQVSESTLNSQIKSHERRRKLSPGNSPIKKKPMKIEEPAVVKAVVEKPKKFDLSKIDEILTGIQDLESIKNVLINHLSFSRLLQTPLNQLQSISHSTSDLSRNQLRAVLHSIQCIGVIYRTGKDAAGKQLEEEYYYDVEKDDDMDRKALISSLKGSRVGLRSCRKTHKQYFWKKPGAKK